MHPAAASAPSSTTGRTPDTTRAGQFTLLWNDPALNIWWAIRDPILSERDQGRRQSFQCPPHFAGEDTERYAGVSVWATRSRGIATMLGDSGSLSATRSTRPVIGEKTKIS